MTKPEKIRVKVSGRRADTAYIALPGHRAEPGEVVKTLRLESIIEDYRGPRVHLDFDRQGQLIGIEILA